jgi:hypothetical protein
VPLQIHCSLLLHLSALLLQGQPPAPATPSVPVSLERIRRGLEAPDVTIRRTDPGLPPLFRIDVQERFLRYEHLWKDESITPAFVRPSRGLVHHEFLEQVTPDLFRGTALHPCCDLLPLVTSAWDKLRRAKHARDESKARQEVQRALAEFMRDRRKQDHER